jgi:hypothetical protein
MDILSKLTSLANHSPASKIYAKLDEGQDQIRLATILPGFASNPIRCTIQVVSDVHSLNYQTLSYVWGDQTLQKEIDLNGHLFRITYNLHLALH